jgi:hypothetical protein
LIIETLSDPSSGAVIERMRLIVRFHENSVARKGSHAGDGHRWAEASSPYQRGSSARPRHRSGKPPERSVRAVATVL